MPLPITALYAGALALFLIPLTLRVVKNRYRAKVSIMDGGDDVLALAIRVHGNFVEYVPFALILLAIIEMNGAEPWRLHLIGAALVIGRLLHVYGLSRGRAGLPTRRYGMIATMAVFVGAGGSALAQALIP